ncbi:transposase [Paenibacillus sp. GCM10012303]|uniref:transposase n=1 Tax=Paenibacillus sp. GCM10012303 TaxID=3317340 RepID=UPI00360DDFD2
MKLLIVIGMLVVPVLFVWLRRISGLLKALLDALALVSAFGFGLLSAFAVQDIRAHGTVYATEVHHVFENWAFLLFGSYLGLYLLYLLLWSTMTAYRRTDS